MFPSTLGWLFPPCIRHTCTCKANSASAHPYSLLLQVTAVTNALLEAFGEGVAVLAALLVICAALAES